MSKIRALAPDARNKEKNKDITTKQWIVYYYLLSISKWNAKDKEDHYFFYTKQLNITKICAFLGISRPTFYNAFDKLYHKRIIYDNPNTKGLDVTPEDKVKIKETKVFYVKIPKIYAELERNLLTFLLGYQKFVGIDLVRTYVILKKTWDLSFEGDEDRKITKRYIVELLGHHICDTSMYQQVELYLGMLSYWGLISVSKRVINKPVVGHYTEFKLLNVIDKAPEIPDGDYNAPIDEELFNKVKKELEADPTWNLGDKSTN